MMRTPKFLTLVVASVLALASSASAITLRITDRDLQGLIAQGDSSGNRLNLRVASSASGPVMVFIYDGGTVTSYRAVLRGGQIILEGQPETSLTKLLAGRGLTLTTEVVESAAPRNFSFPGLNSAPSSAPSGSTTSGNTSPGSTSPGNSPAAPATSNANPAQGGNGSAGDGKGKDSGSENKGKDNGKDKEKEKEKEKDKEKDKGKGKP